MNEFTLVQQFTRIYCLLYNNNPAHNFKEDTANNLTV